MIQTIDEVLTRQQVEEYRDAGYLVVPDLLTEGEIEAFLDHNRRPRPQEWQLGLRTHTADPQWRSLATHPRVLAVVRQLLGGPPMIVQTMFLDKPASGGRGIALHQDSYYLPNEPNTLMACWVALTDTDGENGGLCVVPGSHREGLQQPHVNRDQEEHVTWETDHTMRDRDGKEWKQTLVAAQLDVDPDRIVRLTVPRGGGVFFTGKTIHGSFSNRSSDRPRPAFATHYVREGTWLFRTDVQELTAGE